MPSGRFFVNLVALACLAGPAAAENFALVSPSAADALKAKRMTPEGRYAIGSANKALDRPPAAMPKIEIASTLPHHGLYDQSQAAVKDFTAMRDLAIAYRLSGDRRYLSTVKKYLEAWVDTYHSSFNPIDDSNFYPLFLAYDLCRADIPSDLKRRTDDWMRGISEGYLDAIPRSKDVNNWQSHRVNLATLAAFSTGDEQLISQARSAFEQQVAVNVNPDGSVWDFYKRDAIHYVTYDLEPLMMASVAAAAHHQNWYTYKSASGSSLRGALDWLTPYATGAKSHEEFVHSEIKFDAERNEAGERGFSGAWDPKGAILTYSLASALDPKNREILGRIENHTGSKTPHWIELLFLH